VKWTRMTTEGVPPKEFDRQAAKGRPLHRGSIALYRGRLFVGTGAEGRIYAAPYEEKGVWTSKPAKFEDCEKLTLSWEGSASGLRLQVRTAERSEDLGKVSWKPAEKAPTTIVLPRRQPWVQYRAEFESEGRVTPVLKSVSLSRN